MNQVVTTGVFLLLLISILPITSSLEEGDRDDLVDPQGSSIDQGNIGQNTRFQSAGEITGLGAGSTSAEVPAGATASRTGSGISVSTVSSASGGGMNFNGGTNVEFSSDGSLAADHIERIDFSTPQGTMQAEGVSGVQIQANGDFTIASADSFRSADGSVIIGNAENIVSRDNSLTVGRGSSLSFRDARSTNPRNAVLNWQDTFTVEEADVVVIDNAVFTDIAQSTFIVQSGKLQSATVSSAIDRNVATIPNPIPGSSPLIIIRYDADETFRIELDKVDEGRKMVHIIPVDPVQVGFGERGTPQADNGWWNAGTTEENDGRLPDGTRDRGSGDIGDSRSAESGARDGADDFAPGGVRDSDSAPDTIPDGGGFDTFIDRITFSPTGDDAELSLIADSLPIYRLTQGQLNFTAPLFVEILDANCDASEAAIHYDAGFIRLALSPFIRVLCPGGRYRYLDAVKEKSYSILNTGEETFELGLNKNNLLSDVLFLAGLHDDLSHGYVDFPIFLELWGMIEYDRLRDFNQQIETRGTYEMLNLPFQSVYRAFADHNHALINLRGGLQADLRVDSPQLDPGIETYGIVDSGAHRITERFFGEKILQFFDYNKRPIHTAMLVRYSSVFIGEKPPISFTEQVLDLRCPAAQNVTLYAEGSPAGRRFSDDLAYLAGITFDAYVKKYGGGIAVATEVQR